MKLLDLVNLFKTDIVFEDFLKNNSLNSNSESIEIYMIDKVDSNSELAFFEIENENTDGLIIFEKNNVKYHSFFDFHYFIDFMDEVKENKNLSSEKLVEILINYSINDA